MTQALKRSISLALLCAAPLLVGAAPAQAPIAPPGPVPSAVPPAETLTPPVVVVPFIQPFDLDATRRMSVQVMIGGKGPYSFLVDTGAERTVIARELAERLGLVEGAKLRLATIGSSTTVPSYRIAALQMSDLHLAGVDAPAFFGRHIGAAGLIGVDMLEERRILIDFRKESMQILETRRRAPTLIKDDDAIVVTARNSAGPPSAVFRGLITTPRAISITSSRTTVQTSTPRGSTPRKSTSPRPNSKRRRSHRSYT